jgi:CO dehydrogenase/acetyl-CoA synthase gamma subunit (corrinoid Fe-S protein)
MPLSVVDLYRDILPKTNCKECGYATCMAFASMVVSEKLPLKNCPHLKPDVIEKCQKELDAQYAAGKWLKRDMAQDALA